MQTFVNKIDDVIPKLLKLDRDTLFDIKITKHKEWKKFKSLINDSCTTS